MCCSSVPKMDLLNNLPPFKKGRGGDSLVDTIGGEIVNYIPKNYFNYCFFFLIPSGGILMMEGLNDEKNQSESIEVPYD